MARRLPPSSTTGRVCVRANGRTTRPQRRRARTEGWCAPLLRRSAPPNADLTSTRLRSTAPRSSTTSGPTSRRSRAYARDSNRRREEDPSRGHAQDRPPPPVLARRVVASSRRSETETTPGRPSQRSARGERARPECACSPAGTKKGTPSSRRSAPRTACRSCSRACPRDSARLSRRDGRPCGGYASYRGTDRSAPVILTRHRHRSLMIIISLSLSLSPPGKALGAVVGATVTRSR